MKRKVKAPKIGRPRKDEKVVRAKPRGVRLHPEMLKRVDRAVEEERIPGVSTFTGAVEVALTSMLDKIDARGTF